MQVRTGFQEISDFGPFFGKYASLSIPDTKIILPTAPTRKITLNRGAMTGWFDMAVMETDDPEDRTGFQESSARVSSIVEAEIVKGIDPKKIIIASFSQGLKFTVLLMFTVMHMFYMSCYLL